MVELIQVVFVVLREVHFVHLFDILEGFHVFRVHNWCLLRLHQSCRNWIQHAGKLLIVLSLSGGLSWLLLKGIWVWRDQLVGLILHGWTDLNRLWHMKVDVPKHV